MIENTQFVAHLQFEFTTMQFTRHSHRYEISKNGRMMFEFGPGLNGMKSERLGQYEFDTSHPTQLSAHMYTLEDNLDKNKAHFLSCCFGVIRRQRRIKEARAKAALAARYKNRTFAMIKPDAFNNETVMSIIECIKASEFRILSLESRMLRQGEAEWLYQEHQDKEWFGDQIAFIMSNHVVLLLLESDKETAVEDFRTFIGKTDSKLADEGTIRNKFGNPLIMRENAIHGSDSLESAKREIDFFFTNSSKQVS